MKVNLINTGNYEIYRRHNHSDGQSNDSKNLGNPQSKSAMHKIVREGNVLNSDRIDVRQEINPQYRHTSPVAKSSETFDAVFEVIEQEVVNNPESMNELVEQGKLILYPESADPGYSTKDELGKGYIISIPSPKRPADQRDHKLLRAQKRLFDKYNKSSWRQPGMLVNLSF